MIPRSLLGLLVPVASEYEGAGLAEICRHGAGDPDCSNSAAGRARVTADNAEYYRREAAKLKEQIAALQQQLQAAQYATSPDSEEFEILDAEEVGKHLVLKVQYPNCTKCAFEGVKVMVIFGSSLRDALRWRIIDPHFRNMEGTNDPRQAPAPAARFPGDLSGWDDAVAWARSRA